MSFVNHPQGYYQTTYTNVDRVLNERMLRIGNLIVFLGDKMTDWAEDFTSELDRCVDSLSDFSKVEELRRHIMETLINAVSLIPNKSSIYSSLFIRLFE